MSYFPDLLKRQKALVTSANLVLHLAKAGTSVVVNHHLEQGAAREIVQGIQAKGGEAIAVGANVDKEEVPTMFEQMFQHFGTIDILVNNSGVQKDAALVDTTLEDWNLVIGVSLIRQFL